ncbi:type IV toxin-antitoxin system AbiEi family antitoxin domain-containing protein [Patescibacteria group bacterium]|nr:type IV toxin-antitoxin system AbiEi family antitoxin domain-containing protein [Patescibacteria group bacterium]MBU1722089.1 type IV toxin-antitoxin system AbiEi family antitoxin domain-containing protein [Patescibacteria group bacterium]MBU1901369.1 type IV toxin-antitoxin system AbiEi family antitoxin domain-containing protein [Patescibacteria group bacterium]
MNVQEFLTTLKKIRKVFTLQDITLIFGSDAISSVQLSRWQKQGYITKLRRGVYAMSEYIEDIPHFFIANIVYDPSYVSLESALYEYNFIPDIPHAVTSVSSKKTTSFHILQTDFLYHNIKESAFIGYKPLSYGDYTVLFAEPEKAIVDFLYLKAKEYKDDEMEELRFNYEEMNIKIDKKKLLLYASLLGNTSLDKKIAYLLKKI